VSLKPTPHSPPPIHPQVRMSADDTETLPLDYQPDLIASYWSRRPVSVVTRIMQLIGEQ
jgi:hypothetical protein